MVFLGQRVILLVASTHNLNVMALRVVAHHLDVLFGSRRLHEGAPYSKRKRHPSPVHLLEIGQRAVHHHLEILGT